MYNISDLKDMFLFLLKGIHRSSLEFSYSWYFLPTIFWSEFPREHFYDSNPPLTINKIRFSFTALFDFIKYIDIHMYYLHLYMYVCKYLLTLTSVWRVDSLLKWKKFLLFAHKTLFIDFYLHLILQLF